MTAQSLLPFLSPSDASQTEVQQAGAYFSAVENHSNTHYKAVKDMEISRLGRHGDWRGLGKQRSRSYMCVCQLRGCEQTKEREEYSNRFGHLVLKPIRAPPVRPSCRKKKKKLWKILENSQPSRRTSHGRKGTGTGAHRTSWCTQMFRLPKARQGGGSP